MPVLIADLSKVTEQVLADLIGIAENETLEFKRDTYGSDDKARRELCKDVSALANTLGGDIVLGIDEVDGVASAIVGLNCADINGEIQRLQNIVSMAIEPIVLGVRFRSIPLSNGQPALMIRVPRSLDAPHRVTHSGINRFYVRRTTDTFEASLTELRRMFELAGNEFDNAERFRAERMTRIASDKEAYPLSAKSEGYCVLHIVPFGFNQRVGSVDLSQLEGDKFRQLGNPLGFSTRYGVDGFIIYRGTADCHGYTAVMRSGAIEATKSDLLLHNRDHGRCINIAVLAKDMQEGLVQYIGSLRQIGASGPWIVMFTLAACEGVRLVVSQRGWEIDGLGPQLNDASLSFPSVLVDEQSSPAEMQDVMRPILDALWQAAAQPKFS